MSEQDDEATALREQPPESAPGGGRGGGHERTVKVLSDAPSARAIAEDHQAGDVDRLLGMRAYGSSEPGREEGGLQAVSCAVVLVDWCEEHSAPKNGAGFGVCWGAREDMAYRRGQKSQHQQPPEIAPTSDERLMDLNVQRIMEREAAADAAGYLRGLRAAYAIAHRKGWTWQSDEIHQLIAAAQSKENTP